MLRLEKQFQTTVLDTRKRLKERVRSMDRSELLHRRVLPGAATRPADSTQVDNLASQVTTSLRRVKQNMQDEIEKSILSYQILERSTKRLNDTGKQYDEFGGVLGRTRTALKQLWRRERADQYWISGAFLVFGLSAAYVFAKRIWIPPVGPLLGVAKKCMHRYLETREKAAPAVKKPKQAPTEAPAGLNLENVVEAPKPPQVDLYVDTTAGEPVHEGHFVDPEQPEPAEDAEVLKTLQTDANNGPAAEEPHVTAADTAQQDGEAPAVAPLGQDDIAAQVAPKTRSSPDVEDRLHVGRQAEAKAEPERSTHFDTQEGNQSDGSNYGSEYMSQDDELETLSSKEAAELPQQPAVEDPVGVQPPAPEKADEPINDEPAAADTEVLEANLEAPVEVIASAATTEPDAPAISRESAANFSPLAPDSLEAAVPTEKSFAPDRVAETEEQNQPPITEPSGTQIPPAPTFPPTAADESHESGSERTSAMDSMAGEPYSSDISEEYAQHTEL